MIRLQPSPAPILLQPSFATTHTSNTSSNTASDSVSNPASSSSVPLPSPFQRSTCSQSSLLSHFPSTGLSVSALASGSASALTSTSASQRTQLSALPFRPHCHSLSGRSGRQQTGPVRDQHVTICRMNVVAHCGTPGTLSRVHSVQHPLRTPPQQLSNSFPSAARLLQSMAMAAPLAQSGQQGDQAGGVRMQGTNTPGTGLQAIQEQGGPTQGPKGPLRSLDVAVIGAGAAGLVAARELLREGHRVSVYEQDPGLGGVWRYDPQQEDDPLGVSEQRRAASGVHSSMYASLRTNLPRELMGFTDFPFSYPLPTDGHSSYTSAFDSPGTPAFDTPGPSPLAQAPPGSPAGLPEGNSSGTPAVGDPEPVGDARRFPGHAEVLRYLAAFARHYGLEKHIRYSVRVTGVTVAGAAKDGGSAEGQPRFLVQTAPAVRNPRVSAGIREPSTQGAERADEASPGAEGGSVGANGAANWVGGVEEGGVSTKIFDAVVVCNGHYSQPRVADIEGIETWPGKQMHSHNYRHPDMFKDKVVVLLGAASSGDDISKEVARVARSVHMTSRGWQPGNVPQRMPERWPNLWYHPMVRRAHEDGSIEFGDGSRVEADIVLHCTGAVDVPSVRSYHYSFPFLNSLSPALSISNNRVGPLYKHVFPPKLAPGLSLLGLPWKVVPFPLVELQAKWVAQLLSRRRALPSVAEMEEDTERLYAELEARGVPQDYTHCLSLPGVPFGDQFDYDDWLARETGYKEMPLWRRTMYKCTSERKRREPWCYRDDFDDEEPLQLANQEIEKLNRHIEEEMEKAVPLFIG